MESSQQCSSGPHLMTLPSELHLQISTYLSYPDALALKHTSRHFYSIVSTGVHLKVEWLLERFEQRLECPMEKCSFYTDETFCNSRIRRIMERRRWHLECRPVNAGCIVVHGKTCRTDLLPTWFRIEAQGKKRLMRTVWGWGQDAFVIGIIAVLLSLLWSMAQ